MDLTEELRSSIVRICGVAVDEIRPDATLDELGIDSLAAAEIITDLEIRTGTELPMDVLRGLSGLRTLGEMATHLQAGVDRAATPGRP